MHVKSSSLVGGIQNVTDLENPIEVVTESLAGRLWGSSQLRGGSFVSLAAEKLIPWTTYVLGYNFGSLEVPSSRTGVVLWVGARQM